MTFQTLSERGILAIALPERNLYSVQCFSVSAYVKSFRTNMMCSDETRDVFY